MNSVRDQIIARLTELAPIEIEVIDDSGAHAGHAGAVQHQTKSGHSGETHFEIRIVSAAFRGLTLVARHRMIYALLHDLMKSQIHALKIDAHSA
jgi:BolA family transcriptional regulator, general stress-responsive regulator